MLSRPAKDVRVVRGAHAKAVRDEIAAEEPLEIRLKRGKSTSGIAITMRTPGEDGELALGFLFAEGVVSSRSDLAADEPFREICGAVTVSLAPGVTPTPGALDRHFFTSSACGACGKRTIENLLTRGCPRIGPGPRIRPDLLYSLPGRMREAQAAFHSTGGLHAAALFSPEGELLLSREDVGRHNALDKVVGRALLDGLLPLTDRILLVSGRASFELVQKAAAAGAPVLAAVSAPTSLAIETAERTGVTLVAFLRDRRFNVYSHLARIESPGPAETVPDREIRG